MTDRAAGRPAAGGGPDDRASDDRGLIFRAQRGERAAVDQLLRRHQPGVYAVCRRITGNDADALDATQEALIAIVRGLHRFDGRSRLSTWIYRVATNASLDELRRRRRRPASSLPDALAAAPSPSAPTEDRLADRIDVDDALRRVPLDFRVAVVLRDLCTLDYAAIAEVLDIPVGTVRSRIARGRAMLATHLAGNRPSPPRRQSTTAHPPAPPHLRAGSSDD